MSVRHALVLAVVASAVAGPVHAEKMSKENKKWLEEEVAAIILTSEEKTFKDMKEADRPEFQKIFWSRRDTGIDTPRPDNDFRAEFMKKKAEADLKFKAQGRVGSATDCGKTWVLLGEPDDRKNSDKSDPIPGKRQAETWTYKDKPSLRVKDGSMQVLFDEQCQFAQGAHLGEQLQRVAEGKVARPSIEFRFGKDGKLVKLLDLLPKPTAAQALVKEPRTDFPLDVQAQFLKVSDGGSALVGLVHGKAEGLTTAAVDAAGKRAAKVTVAALAIDPDGRVLATYEQATLAPIENGMFTACYRLGVKPGKYKIVAGALDETTKKGSAVGTDAEVPDFNTGELTMATVILVKDIEEQAQNDPAHPFAAYQLGGARLLPRFGTAFTKDDTLSFFYQYYDGKVDQATGKASVLATVQIDKDGKTPVAKAADQTFDLVVGGTVIGPVPLAKYDPGKYVVKLKLTDNVAKKDVTRDVPFEIVAK
jgi:GWxTD domain-containing protein